MSFELVICYHFIRSLIFIMHFIQLPMYCRDTVITTVFPGMSKKSPPKLFFTPKNKLIFCNVVLTILDICS